jgi:hypothetical protein
MTQEQGNKMLEYEERLQAMLDELRRSDAIELSHLAACPFRDYLGDARTTFAMLAKDQGLKLAPSLERCFHRAGGLAAYWRLAEPGSTAAGEFKLVNLYEAILLGAPVLSPATGSGDTAELLASFRVIDDQPQGGTGTFAALRIQPEVASPEVWFYNGTRGSVKLDVDYCGYLDALLVTKGFYYWQYLFADVSLAQRQYADTAKQLQLMLDVLPRLFTKHDYSPLRERLAHRLAGRRT